MIKNIVFDMGKVLVAYEADAVARHFIEDEKERKDVCTSVFVSPEWLMLDMGVISEEDALKRMQARLDTDHAREMARMCLEHWHERDGRTGTFTEKTGIWHLSLFQCVAPAFGLL